MLAQWLKKKLHIVVLVVLALCVFPVQAFASSAASASDDELIYGYIEQRLNENLPSSGVPFLRARPSTHLTGNDQRVYEALKVAIAEIAAGERTSTYIDVPVSAICSKTYWTAAELGLDTVVDDYGWPTDEAYDAAWAKVDFDFGGVMDALLTDCVYELYWYDKTYGVGMSGYPWPSAQKVNGEYVVGFDPDDSYTLYFSVSADYAVDNELGTYVVDPTTGRRVSTAVKTAASVAAADAGKPAYERLYGFRDWICENVDYNWDAVYDPYTPYGDPWQLISVFDGDPTTDVVCEGYSKAFQYLCDLANIPNVNCYTVTGNAGGPHMWNLVNMDDGRVYLVDITNCDEDSIGYPDDLFIAEYTSIAGDYAYYVGSYGMCYQYDSDTLAVYQPSELEISATPYGESDGTIRGNWGSCPWELTEAGVLTIHPGEGVEQEPISMGGDYYFYESPWIEYADNITAVIFKQEGTAKVIAPSNCSALLDCLKYVTYVDVSGLDTSKTTSMFRMFSYCKALRSLDLSGFDTSNVTDMCVMFENCESLEWVDLSSFNTENVTDMCQMFLECYKLANLDLSSFSTPALEDAWGMFRSCQSLTELDLSSFSFSSVQKCSCMFYDCSALTTIHTCDEWDFGSLVMFSYGDEFRLAYQDMFDGCVSLVGGNGTAYDPAHTSGEYARIDSPGTPGYLTGVPKTSIATAQVTIANATYTGSPITPEMTVTLKGQKLFEGADYTVKYSNNTNVGTATVILTGAGHYEGTKTVTFRIERANLEDATISSIPNQTYTGKALTPAITVTLGGKTLVKGTDYTVEYKNNTNVGTATVTVTGTGNYMGSASRTFKIVHKPGWEKVNGYWYYYDEDGMMVTFDWVKSGNDWYFMDFDGTMITNCFLTINDDSFYLDSDGKMLSGGWYQLYGSWYYFRSNGKMYVNEWLKSGGAWYYFDEDGRMVANDWVYYDGAWYHFASNGKVQYNAWVKSGGSWYYMGSNGKMVTNDWIKYKGTWYHFNGSGVCDRTA